MKSFALLVALTQALSGTFVQAVPSTLNEANFVKRAVNPISGSENIVVRDPAIWYNSASRKYFIFSTGEKIRIFHSGSLNGPWTRNGSVVPNCSTIQKGGRCELWAPDVNFINGSYALYYSVSTLGSQDSAIGVATSPSMEPGSWTDLGQVIASKPGDIFNAIDPNIIDWQGLKLSFGSWWQGIYQVGLWPDVKTQASPLPGTYLAGGGGRPIEGPFVYKSTASSYYFCFFSEGITPLQGSTTRPPPGEEYKVRVGRGANAMGPFYDQAGRQITVAGAGTIMLSSHDNVYAPGGQSLFRDPVSGRDVIAYHYVRNNNSGGPSYLGINYVNFSSGWPVIVA